MNWSFKKEENIPNRYLKGSKPLTWVNADGDIFYEGKVKEWPLFDNDLEKDFRELANDGWIHASYIKKLDLFTQNNEEDKVLVRDLGSKGKNLIELHRLKREGKKFHRFYRLKNDQETIKKIFLFFYETGMVWQIVPSNYYKTNFNSFLLEDNWLEGSYDLNESNSMIKTTLTFPAQPLPPSLAYKYFTDRNGLREDIRDKFSGFNSLILMLKVQEAFWEEELAGAPEKLKDRLVDSKQQDFQSLGEIKQKEFKPTEYCKEQLNEIRNRMSILEKLNGGSQVLAQSK